MTTKTVKICGVEYSRDEVPDALSYPLKRPLSIGSICVDTLELQEPTAGDYEEFTKISNGGNTVGAMLSLINRVTVRSNKEISLPLIKSMGMKDLWEVSGYFIFFTNPPL